MGECGSSISQIDIEYRQASFRIPLPSSEEEDNEKSMHSTQPCGTPPNTTQRSSVDTFPVFPS